MRYKYDSLWIFGFGLALAAIGFGFSAASLAGNVGLIWGRGTGSCTAIKCTAAKDKGEGTQMRVAADKSDKDSRSLPPSHTQTCPY